MWTAFRIISNFFFFSSRRRHTRSDRDWSSDVCSSDLGREPGPTLALIAGTHGDEVAPIIALLRDDRGDFVTMGAGDQREGRPRLSAADDGERHARAGIDAGRDLDEPRAHLTGTRRRGSDMERSRLLR